MDIQEPIIPIAYKVTIQKPSIDALINQAIKFAVHYDLSLDEGDRRVLAAIYSGTFTAVTDTTPADIKIWFQQECVIRNIRTREEAIPNKISLIKAYRNFHKSIEKDVVGLKESKEVIEALIDTLFPFYWS